jgi:hypothetical protein
MEGKVNKETKGSKKPGLHPVEIKAHSADDMIASLKAKAKGGPVHIVGLLGSKKK